MNPYFIISLTDLWNPNLALIFSFLLFIFLYEYIDSKNENIVRFSVVIIFPIIALISQLHFFTFFSVVPTIIIYLLIRFKRTKQYLTFWVIGVFLSFLQYVPYLMYELQSGFLNMKNIIKTIYDDSNGGMDVNLISIYGERKETYCDISKNLFSEYAWNCNNNGTNLYILIDFIKLNNSDDPAYPKYINYLASNSKLIYTNEYILVYKFQHSNDELLSPENFI